MLVSHCWEQLWRDTCRSEGYLIAFSSRCSPKKQESTRRCRDRLQGSFLICSPGMWGCSIEALLFLLPPALADDLCQLHKSASLLSVHLLCTSTMFRICVFSSHVVKITFKVISGNIFFSFSLNGKVAERCGELAKKKKCLQKCLDFKHKEKLVFW